jgi:hypothetical protein
MELMRKSNAMGDPFNSASIHLALHGNDFIDSGDGNDCPSVGAGDDWIKNRVTLMLWKGTCCFVLSCEAANDVLIGGASDDYAKDGGERAFAINTNLWRMAT